MPLGFPTYRDTPTKYGGVIRIFPNGTTIVLVRDFGLTTEPECSEEAHAKMSEWLHEHMPEVFLVPVPFIVGEQQSP
jgi:hypothetical protein